MNDGELKNFRKSLAANLEQLIFPILRKLKRRGSALDQRYLELLERNLLELTSGFGSKLINSRWKLTAREIEICNMIRGGLSTKSIADILCVSQRTVEHHRHHIRKKLGLSEPSEDLVEYLTTLSI